MVYIEYAESLPERSDGREIIKGSENHCDEAKVWPQDRDYHRGDSNTCPREAEPVSPCLSAVSSLHPSQSESVVSLYAQIELGLWICLCGTL